MTRKKKFTVVANNPPKAKPEPQPVFDYNDPILYLFDVSGQPNNKRSIGPLEHMEEQCMVTSEFVLDRPFVTLSIDGQNASWIRLSENEARELACRILEAVSYRRDEANRGYHAKYFPRQVPSEFGSDDNWRPSKGLLFSARAVVESGKKQQRKKQQLHDAAMVKVERRMFDALANSVEEVLGKKASERRERELARERELRGEG